MKSSLFAVLFAGVAAAPLFAQVDLTGFWHNPTEEDQIERGPGPISGD